MRFFAVIATLAAVLTVTPAQAQGLSVGDFVCATKLPCNPTDPSFPPMDQLLAKTEACVSRSSDLNPGQSVLYPEGMGPDGCFSTNASAFRQTGGPLVVPRCCLQQIPAGWCVVRCTMEVQ